MFSKTEPKLTAAQNRELAFKKAFVSVVRAMNKPCKQPQNKRCVYYLYLGKNVIVSDLSRTAKVTFWEDHVVSLQQGRSYMLKHFVVRTFQSTKYLSREANSEIIRIKDIGTVHSLQVPNGIDGVKEVVLMGVLNILSQLMSMTVVAA